MVTFHLYLPNGLTPPFRWWVKADDGRQIAGGETDWAGLSALAEQWGKPALCIWLDGRIVRFVRAKVPSRNRQQLQRAFPYAVEDWFAEDVENLHFALSSPSADGMVTALVVRNLVMTQLVAQLTELDWSPQLVTADYCALPPGTIVKHPERVLLNLLAEKPADDAVGAFDTSVGEEALRLWQSSAENSEVDMIIVGEGETAPQAAQVKDWPEILQKPSAEAVNLLQSPYTVRTANAGSWKKFRSLIVSATAALLLLLALGVVTQLDLSHRIKQLQAAQRRVFQQTFPDVRARNPYRQMRAMARQGAGVSQGEFLTLLTAFHRAYTTTKDVDVTSIQYRSKKNELQVDLVAPDYQTFEQLKAALSAKGMQVKPISANRSGERYTGRLVFSGAQS